MLPSLFALLVCSTAYGAAGEWQTLLEPDASALCWGARALSLILEECACGRWERAGRPRSGPLLFLGGWLARSAGHTRQVMDAALPDEQLVGQRLRYCYARVDGV